MLSVPFDKMRDFMIAKGALKLDFKNKWESAHRKSLLRFDDLEIVTTYNSEIRGFYQYYKYAHNVYKLHGMHNIMKYSWLKTLASKHSALGVSNLLRKHNYKSKKELGVHYETPKGKRFRAFYNEGFNRELNFPRGSAQHPPDGNTDLIANFIPARSGLQQRLMANTCEWCGTTEGAVEVHHVRKLKDLKGKKQWEVFMISRIRKTVVMCKTCHVNLHAGRLD
ncbi:Group II intron-encoded protein LtrA [compost metagenome]